jgi:hypothetical protein
MNENSLQVLRGARVLLRTPRESDRNDRLAAGRDLEFRRMVGGTGPDPGPLTTSDVDRWFASVAAEPFGCWPLAGMRAQVRFLARKSGRKAVG